MVDLDSVQARLDERSAPSATGGNLLLASATLEFTKGQQPLTHATEIGRIQTFWHFMRFEHAVKRIAG